MFNYIEHLVSTKKLMKEYFDVDILKNLENFSLECDRDLNDFYSEILKLSINTTNNFTDNLEDKDLYYIKNIKPIYINQVFLYEITFVPTSQINNKNNKIIAFSNKKPAKNYSCSIQYETKEIVIKNIPLNIKIIKNWFVHISDKEINKFSDILKIDVKIKK